MEKRFEVLVDAMEEQFELKSSLKELDGLQIDNNRKLRRMRQQISNMSI
jgi:hypothetical protein